MSTDSGSWPARDMSVPVSFLQEGDVCERVRWDEETGGRSGEGYEV